MEWRGGSRRPYDTWKTTAGSLAAAARAGRLVVAAALVCLIGWSNGLKVGGDGGLQLQRQQRGSWRLPLIGCGWTAAVHRVAAVTRVGRLDYLLSAADERSQGQQRQPLEKQAATVPCTAAAAAAYRHLHQRGHQRSYAAAATVAAGA